MINLELYRIFYVVAETKNITKASEILNISQPAVTKHIKNLEEQLGNPLFIRTKKGVILNKYGEKIFLNVKQALNLLSESEKEISKYKSLNKGTIKIGISTTLARKYLLKYIKKFHETYPNIVIDIYTDATKDLIKQLKNGVIDIIISKFPQNRDNDLDYIYLDKTKYIFVANEEYSFLSNKTIPIKKLVNYPLLLQKTPSNSRDNIEKYLKENNINIEPKMNIASSNLLVDFIRLGYGIGYVTKLYVEEELKEKKLFEIKVVPDTDEISYGIILLKNNVMTSHCKKFIDYLKPNEK